MTITTQYLCIGCPLGCHLEVDADHERIVEIRGFSCKRGKEYAAQEHTDPRRFVTTTVSIAHADWARLPVRTQRAVPKDKLRAVCQVLQKVNVQAPIYSGEVIVRDVLGTGIDIIATRDMPRVS
jgi:CxxC motif-containing protein